MGSTWRLALSGLAVGVNSGLSNQNQNSVDEDAALVGGDDADADVTTLRPRLVAQLQAIFVVGDPRIFSSTAW